MNHIDHLEAVSRNKLCNKCITIIQAPWLKKENLKITTKISLSKYHFSLFNYPFEQTIPKSACLVVNYSYDLPLEKFEYQCMLCSRLKLAHEL